MKPFFAGKAIMLLDKQMLDITPPRRRTALDGDTAALIEVNPIAVAVARGTAIAVVPG